MMGFRQYTVKDKSGNVVLKTLNYTKAVNMANNIGGTVE